MSYLSRCTNFRREKPPDKSSFAWRWIISCFGLVWVRSAEENLRRRRCCLQVYEMHWTTVKLSFCFTFAQWRRKSMIDFPSRSLSPGSISCCLALSLSFWFRNRTKDEYFNVNLIWLNTISLQNFLTYACRRWKTVESGTFSSFPRPKSTHKGQTKFGRQENDCCCTQTQQQKWETKSVDDDDRGMRCLSRLRIRRFWRLEETQWKKYESLGKRQL